MVEANIEPVSSSANDSVQQVGSAANQVRASQGEYTAATVVKSMAEVREKAPKVYNAMLQGIAQSICSRMKRSQDRLAAMMRKARQ